MAKSVASLFGPPARYFQWKIELGLSGPDVEQGCCCVGTHEGIGGTLAAFCVPTAQSIWAVTHTS